MNKLFIIIILLNIFSCNNSISINQKKNTEDKSRINNEHFKLVQSSIKEYNIAKTKFKDEITFDTLNIKKVNGVFKLELFKNKFISFKDKLPKDYDPDISEFRYIGQHKNLDLYIVNGIFWENDEYYLINKKTGKKTTIWNKPLFSTNNQFIANLSMPYGLEGIPNGIQIWKINNNSKSKKNNLEISKLIEIDQQNWVPIEIFWISNSSLILKVTSIKNYLKYSKERDNDKLYYLKLNII